MNKFRLPRKRKKQYRKDNPLSVIHYNQYSYEWFYNKQRVKIKAMCSIIVYPETSTKEQILAWYINNYPEDKRAHQICRQLKY